ncbi:type II secretion system protein GspD [Anaerobaca lacustris]|uniref:Type II and III secretion system protein n=1 Tax=Anaerobaca lacustris TaxID=3044600 RepID=A0AAW6TSP6_9BACT|nr:type II and III secretion system protein [Sedimentisphaerales bacterium M17dextr]
MCNPAITFRVDRMRGTSRIRIRLLVAILAVASVVLQGCHSWPEERDAAIETERVFDEVSRIEPPSDTVEPWPAAYRRPPLKSMQIVGGVEEWKLIYFCQHHKAEQLKQIVHEQFAARLFNQAGQSTAIQNYTVTAEPATNQLVVRCAAEQDVDAVLEILDATDLPPIQVRLDCIVSELSASMTMDRETTMLIENLFGEQITLSGKEGASGMLPAFPGASLRSPAREKFGLKIGVSEPLTGHQVQVLVDLLVSRGYLKVLLNPTLEVLNGQTARIESKQHVPIQSIEVQTGGFGEDTILRTETEYYDVIDSLQVTPQVFADGSVSLETRVQMASYLAPQGVTQTQIVTERVLTSKNSRIRLGQSLVIGGLRRTEKRDVIRGVPILKDIPLLNLLFSGRDAEENVVEVLVILTPTISTQGRPYREIADMIEYRHSTPTGRPAGNARPGDWADGSEPDPDARSDREDPSQP